MRASRIVLVLLGCAAAVGWYLTSGPARESRAQSKPATAPSPVGEQETLPPVGPHSFPPSVPPSVPSPAPLALPPAGPSDTPLPPSPPVEAGLDLPVAPRGGPSDDLSPTPIPPRAEADPEQAAQEFVEKNQKVAEANLAALKKEAEALQSRLRKVEAAIRRWEAVAHALKQSEGVVSKIDGSWKAEPSLNRVRMPIVDEPSELEPIPPPKSILDGPPQSATPRR